MKIRSFLMTIAFAVAITSAVASKSKSRNFLTFSYWQAGHCYLAQDNTDQANCGVSFTGPQCTYLGQPIYDYDTSSNPPAPPVCLVPLRRSF